MDPSIKKGGHPNLHCDVSDAVNVMVDVGFDDEAEYDEFGKGSGGDGLLHDTELGDLRNQHGAIWDIYRWEDTEPILSLLHAVARERDIEITNNPIHDQLFYLDDVLRSRLREQYGVKGWRFIQRRGDAIFIPAGCPHQVRNLSSCVKVALDFVSPENAHRCVTLTDQFAKLPRGHHLSEDKLQVKTMLLHAMAHISKALTAEGSEPLPLPDELPDRVPARPAPQPAAAAASPLRCVPCAPPPPAVAAAAKAAEEANKEPAEAAKAAAVDAAADEDVAMVDAAAAASEAAADPTAAVEEMAAEVGDAMRE